MRVLLCSDIHGNAEALAAVLGEPADYALCAGDLVHFGPQPAACIELIRRHAAAVVRGNHDHGAAFAMDCRAFGPWREVDEASRSITEMPISSADRRYLRGLPLTDSQVLGDVRFTIVHAAPTNPLYRYLPPDAPDAVWRTEVSGLDTDVLVLGHTHLPLVRQEGQTLVVNPGSVGLPRDGLHGAQYAIWEDGTVTLHRCVYDQAPLLDDIARLPLPPDTIQALTVLFQEGALPNT